MAINTKRAVDAILARTQVLMNPDTAGYPPSDDQVLTAMVEEIFTEILNNLEILNINTDITPLFAKAWIGVPVPLDGGTALKVAASAAIAAGMLGIQTNPGTGLIK